MHTLKTIPRVIALLLPLGFFGCATPKEHDEILKREKAESFEEGQADFANKQEARFQEEAAERKAKYTHYRTPFEAGVTADGVFVDQHDTYITIVTQ